MSPTDPPRPITPASSWSPIEDLPEAWQGLASAELRLLSTIWSEQRSRLDDTAVLRDFNERLRREWAIETGILENLYSLDRGTTQVLIEQGIEQALIPHEATDQPVSKVVRLIRDQQAVVEHLFDFVAERRVLSVSYIKEIHAALTQNQPRCEAVDGLGRLVEVELRRGDWKLLPNNPTRRNGSIHAYCPPEHVSAEMDRLVEMHARHVKAQVPPEIEAAWLHHRFTQVHPFQDGNGRVARSLASLVFLRAEWFPLVVTRDDREVYIRALEAADVGDIRPLIELFVSLQKKRLRTMVGLSEDVLRSHEPIKDIIASAVDHLWEKASGQSEAHKVAFEHAEQAADHLERRLQTVATPLGETLKRIDQGYSAGVDRNNEETRHWFRAQIIDAANEIDYFADMRTYAAWVRLRIFEQRRVALVFSFHSLGVRFVGIIGVSCFLEFRDRSEDGETVLEGLHVICREPFHIMFREEAPSMLARFDPWVDECLKIGLDQWRRSI